MANSEKCCHKANCSQRGNAVVIALVIVAVAALGALAFMSGKLDSVLPKKGETEVAAADNPAKDMMAKENEAENKEVIVAKLNGENVSRQDVIDFMNSMPAQMRQIPPEQLFPMAVEQIISNKVIDSKAKSAGLEKDETVIKQLELAKAQLIRAQFIENQIKENMTDERVKSKYDEYLASFPEIQEMNAAHILVDDEKTAKDIIAKLDKGQDFATLAKEFSKDGSGENGGDLGYFAKAEVVPEFADAAYALETGKYSKAPVKSEFGYHIIKAGEKRQRPPAEFSQIKPYIEQELRREILQEVVESLKADFTIERFDINGNPIEQAKPEEKEPAAGDAAVSEPAEESPAEAETQEAPVAE